MLEQDLDGRQLQTNHWAVIKDESQSLRGGAIRGQKVLKISTFYPIYDNEWVSPVQVILKKGTFTVAHNDDDQ